MDEKQRDALEPLFRVEKVSFTQGDEPEVENGCDRCQHCFLVQIRLLQSGGKVLPFVSNNEQKE